jgi:hypothetical protein
MIVFQLFPAEVTSCMPYYMFYNQTPSCKNKDWGKDPQEN